MIEIPGYEIKREIGANAKASVYLALQTSLDRDVALKVILPALADDRAFGQRFMQEARTLASLAHTNIVAVYDVGVTPDNQHYFSMQYLTGGDFAARVRSGINEAELVETLDGVAQALDFVHQRGLVHRDVNPGNIMYDADRTPILTDFGMARARGSSAGGTGTDFSAATGHYMSPEQARGATLDARADIYSLGALTYFGLTGKPPFDGPDGFSVAYAHVFEPIPHLPPALARWQALIDRALAKEPGQRFATAREFLDALNKAASVPIIAPTPTPAVPAAPATAPPPAPAPIKAERSKQPVAPPSIAKPKATVAAPAAMAETYATMPRPPSQVPPVVPVAPAAKASPMGALPAAPSARRRWPLALAAAILVLIGVASYTQFGRRPAAVSDTSTLPPATVSVDANAGSPRADTSPPAALPPVSTEPATPAVPVQDAGATNPDGAAKSASTDATAIPSLDAAAEAAVSEFEPVNDLSKLPTVVDPMVEAIRWGRMAIASQRLTSPPGSNALEYFQFVLKKDPKSKAAKQGIVDIAKKYIELANKAQAGNEAAAYLLFLTNADDVAKTLDEGADVRKDVAARRAKLAEPYLAQAKGAAAEWDKATAKAAYEKALEIDPNGAAAREGLKAVALIGEPGFAFHDKLGDGGQGPDMIVLGGARVAAARHDVTRGEFRRYWNSTGRAAFAGREPACRDRESFFRSSKDRTWQSPGFDQDDSHPVVCVSWDEAAAYAQWLSRESGKRYRLLSVAEFDQLAARASSECTGANLADAAFNRKYESRDGADCNDGFAETSPVDHFELSGGVHDASGNVRVWVAACGNGAAGSSGGSCRDHLAKGRSWLSPPKTKATDADSFGADVGLNSVGFRLVREIDK